MYRKILEYSLNFSLFLFFLFLIFSVKNGWNTLLFFILLSLIVIEFVLIILHREKPKIDIINSKTSAIQRTIIEELTSSFENFLNKHNFNLYHRDLNHFQVGIRYKRKKDFIIFRFYYSPQDFPDWGADVLIGNKNMMKLSFTTLFNLRNPNIKRDEKNAYSLINPKTGEMDEEYIKIIIHNLKEDFAKYAKDFLESDYSNLKKEYTLNKKYYNKNYIHWFSRIKY